MIREHVERVKRSFQSLGALIEQCPASPQGISCVDRAYHGSGVREAIAALKDELETAQANVSGTCHTSAETLQSLLIKIDQILYRTHNDLQALNRAAIEKDFRAEQDWTAEWEAAAPVFESACSSGSAPPTPSTGTGGPPVTINEFASCVTGHGGRAYISALEPNLKGYPGFQGEVKLSELGGQYFSAFVFGDAAQAKRFAGPAAQQYGSDAEIHDTNNVVIAYFGGRNETPARTLENCAQGG